MISSTSAMKGPNRRSSRSNSTSSSVVTVKKAASLSSRSGSRPPHPKARTQSPDQFGFQLTALLTSTPPATAATASRPNSAADNKMPNSGLNANRWSHSTASSVSAIDHDQSRKRKNSSTRRLSVSLTHASGHVPTTGDLPSKLSKEPQLRPRSSPSKSPRRRSPQRFEPRPQLTMPRSPEHNFISSTPSTGLQTLASSDVLASASLSAIPHDYFGEIRDFKASPPRSNGHSIDVQIPGQSSPTVRESPRKLHGSDVNGSPLSFAARSAQNASQAAASSHRGHSRQREPPKNNSVDTPAGSSISSIRSEKDRPRGHRSPTQKNMLSKALSKANTAVSLDNSQDFEGAIEAYGEACDLLQQVMYRSSDAEDKKKLSAIRTTYTARVVELQGLDDLYTVEGEKALPKEPLIHGPNPVDRGTFFEDEAPAYAAQQPWVADSVDIPPRRQSLLPASLITKKRVGVPDNRSQHSQADRAVPASRNPETNRKLGFQMDPGQKPDPMTPIRDVPSSSGVPLDATDAGKRDLDDAHQPQHTREPSESTSWLDTIDESGSSASSSHLSSLDFRPLNGGNFLESMEAELDAALSAAVEAAYGDDTTPVGQPRPMQGTGDPSQKKRNVELARERVREIEQERAREQALRDEQEMRAQQEASHQRGESSDVDYLDEEAEEEERLLEEMTRDYMLTDFGFDKQSKSAVPRQSDSSGFSGRTWASSTNSTSVTTGTSLTTLAEALELPVKQKELSSHTLPVNTPSIPPLPSTETAIPPVPSMPPPQPPSSQTLNLDKNSTTGVRDRRMSGQNAKQLKIETNAKLPTSLQSPKAQQPSILLPSIHIPKGTKPSGSAPISHSSGSLTGQPLTPLTSAHSGDSTYTESPATPALTQAGSQDSVDGSAAQPASPARFFGRNMPPPPPPIRKNMSSSSLRMRNLPVGMSDNDASPITPGSANFPVDPRKAGPVTAPGMPVPLANTHSAGQQSVGGMHLFDDQIGTPNTPKFHKSPLLAPNGLPAPLEPCPESFLLRPFWLMRCLYQTIAHPKGGYLTTKLFVPRDIWRVKNIKLKAIDDKVSQCDLLTAALLKLARVDNLDADAVLEEMQSFELVLEQVRATLHKKLGNDVGLSGSAALFKGSPATEEPSGSDPLGAKGGNAAKSFASSWRKLRSKSSSAGINSSFLNASGKDAGKENGPTMSSLPMTSAAHNISRLNTRRNVAAIKFEGPNAHYMAALARLFDAVQVLDQIARQVEDPGLKYTSKTHVGLELCTRTASEFFGFYICRFALGDVGTMLDKFIKRGSEWVLN